MLDDEFKKEMRKRQNKELLKKSIESILILLLMILTGYMLY